MADADCYRLANDVIHETFEGEVIIANLQGGSYYTLDGVGLDVWTALVAGAPTDRIVSALAAAFTVDEPEVAVVVDRLVGQLTDEQLLLGPTPAEPGAADTEVAVTATTFEAPAFERYTDMQQLLLLDPIHDVDDSGWPAQ